MTPGNARISASIGSHELPVSAKHSCCSGSLHHLGPQASCRDDTILTALPVHHTLCGRNPRRLYLQYVYLMSTLVVEVEATYVLVPH